MSLHNSTPCLQLRLLPLALGAGDYALLGAVYCLASVFCYARQLLLAKSALAKSGLAAEVCNGIGSPVSSRLPWEHQASRSNSICPVGSHGGCVTVALGATSISTCCMP